jgi:hypothetical protein
VFATISATLKYADEQKKQKTISSQKVKKVEWACNFSNEKFNTTFDAIVEHSVPPSSCLVFWYSGLNQCNDALKTGIPVTELPNDLKLPEAQNTLASDNNRNSNKAARSQPRDCGVVVTLHDPTQLNDEDFKYFPNREVVVACSIPKRMLTIMHQTGSSSLSSSSSSLLSSGKTESGIRVISALVIQALRGSYFGEVEDAKRWYLGEIFLPPKVIRRAYQLIEDCSESKDSDLTKKPVLKVCVVFDNG